MSGSNETPFGLLTNDAAIPIVGQAFTLVEIVPVVLLVCNCEAKKMISVPGLNTPAQCPACHRVFSVQVAQCGVDQTTGRKTHNASIALAIPRAVSPT